ncbi:hypothetical protein KTT58_17410 [Pseudomonas viridiflava]|uniref:hypothetical protein n=1 Tax=Pseudomonas viridiflava TaxID=33069 RepID=UPI001C2D31E6|nr:hypothetical protein [Pseudomonas viridiflava]MBV1814525.1 hypothetical protein [Pseudomonas viridiflava]
MQSHNYVPGVSGWKMHSNGTLEVKGKVLAIMVEQAETPELPFAIEGDQVILSQAFIDDSKMSAGWKVRTVLNGAGQRVFAGIGVGIDEVPGGGVAHELGRSSLDAATNASKLLDQISSIIGTVELAQSLRGAADMIKEEASARTAADAMMSARIGSVEAALASLSAQPAAKK